MDERVICGGEKPPEERRTNSPARPGSAHQRHFKVVFGHGVVQLHLLRDLLPAELRPQLSLLLYILTEGKKGKQMKGGKVKGWVTAGESAPP